MSLQGNLNEQQVAEDREAVARDLLSILHKCVYLPLNKCYDSSPSFLASPYNLLLPTVLVW
jgi:hypothetical protein